MRLAALAVIVLCTGCANYHSSHVLVGTPCPPVDPSLVQIHLRPPASYEEIALVTGYQSDTVNTYIKSAVHKLGAKNRSQAVAEAIRQRLIE